VRFALASSAIYLILFQALQLPVLHLESGRLPMNIQPASVATGERGTRVVTADLTYIILGV
jgi:hypothetical protein